MVGHVIAGAYAVQGWSGMSGHCVYTAVVGVSVSPL